MSAVAIHPRVIEINKRIATTTKLRRQLFRNKRAEEQEDLERLRRGQMQPTSERMQKGRFRETQAPPTDERAVAGARVRILQSPIDYYFAHEIIESRQAEAADKLRDDWELGIAGARGESNLFVEGGLIETCVARDYSAAQLDAATRYRKALQAIGPRVAAIVLPVVIGDEGGAEITVRDLAQKLGRNVQSLMGQFGLGLHLLADHYRLK